MYSPDMNRVEHIWDQLSRAVLNHTVCLLRQMLQEEWFALVGTRYSSSPITHESDMIFVLGYKTKRRGTKMLTINWHPLTTYFRRYMQMCMRVGTEDEWSS